MSRSLHRSITQHLYTGNRSITQHLYAGNFVFFTAGIFVMITEAQKLHTVNQD